VMVAFLPHTLRLKGLHYNLDLTWLTIFHYVDGFDPNVGRHAGMRV